MGCTSSKSAEPLDSVSKQNKQPSPAPANGAAASPGSPTKDSNGTAKAKNGDVHQHSPEPCSLNSSVAENNQEKPHIAATNHNGKCVAESEQEANTTSARNGDIVRIDDIHVETSDTAARVEQPAGGEIKACVQSDVDSRIVAKQLTTHATAKTNEDTAVNHVEQKPLEGESAVAFHVAEAADTKHDEPEKIDQYVGKADEIAVVEAEKHHHAEPTDYVTLEAAKHIDAEGEQKVPEVDSQPRLERAAPIEAATENATQADDHHHHAQSAEVTAEEENHTTEELQEAAPEVEEQPEVAPATPYNTEAELAAHDDHHHTNLAEQVTEEVVSQENVPEEAAHSEAEHTTPVEAKPEDVAHAESTEQVAAEVEDHHEESEEKVAEDSQLQEHEASHEEEPHATNESVADEQTSANPAHSTEEVTFPAVPESTDNEVGMEDTQPLSAEVEVASNDSQSAANFSAEADEIAAAETSHSDHVSHHDDSAASKSQEDHDESNTTGEPNEQSAAIEQPADQTEN